MSFPLLFSSIFFLHLLYIRLIHSLWWIPYLRIVNKNEKRVLLGYAIFFYSSPSLVYTSSPHSFYFSSFDKILCETMKTFSDTIFFLFLLISFVQTFKHDFCMLSIIFHHIFLLYLRLKIMFCWRWHQKGEKKKNVGKAVETTTTETVIVTTATLLEYKEIMFWRNATEIRKKRRKTRWIKTKWMNWIR